MVRVKRGQNIKTNRRQIVLRKREKINHLRISNEDIRMEPRKKIMRPEGAYYGRQMERIKEETVDNSSISN
jgi:hypothetical protein